MLGLRAPVGLVAHLVERLRADARARDRPRAAAAPPIRPSALRRSMRYFVMVMIGSFHRDAPARAAETRRIPSNRHAVPAAAETGPARSVPKDTAPDTQVRGRPEAPENPQAWLTPFVAAVRLQVAWIAPLRSGAIALRRTGCQFRAPTGDPDARRRRTAANPALRYRRLPQRHRRRAGDDRHASASGCARATIFWYSPVLNEQLHGKSADVIAAPRDEADVSRVARGLRAACAFRSAARRRRHRQLRPDGAARRRRAARHQRARRRSSGRSPASSACERRRQDERARCRDPAERLGTAHASLDQAHGDHRRLRRRRLGRHRLGDLWRPARARQHLCARVVTLEESRA